MGSSEAKDVCAEVNQINPACSCNKMAAQHVPTNVAAVQLAVGSSSVHL